MGAIGEQQRINHLPRPITRLYQRVEIKHASVRSITGVPVMPSGLMLPQGNWDDGTEAGSCAFQTVFPDPASSA